MPPRWLVDGMNLIGSRPDGWWARTLARRIDEVHAEPVCAVAALIAGRGLRSARRIHSSGGRASGSRGRAG